MNNLITRNNRKSIIILRRLDEGTLAHFFIFDANGNSRLVGTKVLSQEELTELLTLRDTLENQGIYIIEEQPARNSFLLEGLVRHTIEFVETVFNTLPTFDFQLQKAFLTIQKTRGPNN